MATRALPTSRSSTQSVHSRAQDPHRDSRVARGDRPTGHQIKAADPDAGGRLTIADGNSSGSINAPREGWSPLDGVPNLPGRSAGAPEQGPTRWDEHHGALNPVARPRPRRLHRSGTAILLIVGSTSIDRTREIRGTISFRIDELASYGLCVLDPLASEDRVEETVSPTIVGEDMIANASFVLESKPFRDCD